MLKIDASKVAFWNCLVLAALLLAACGGGSASNSGSGTSSSATSSSSAASSVASVSLSPAPASVQLSSYIFAVNAESRSVSLSIQNPPTDFYLTGHYSANAISSISTSFDSQNRATIFISFKLPSYLGAGTYSDLIRAQICKDADCNSGIQASIDIPVSYTVVPVTGSGAPAVAFDPQSLNAEDALLNPSGYSTVSGAVTTALTLTNFLNPPYVLATAQGSLMSSASATVSATSGQLTAELQSPTTLGLGTYTGNVSLKVCIDGPSCAYEASGSPFQIPVTYVVSDVYTVSGTYGFTWRLAPLAANDIAWNAVSQRIYATEVDPSFRSGYLTCVNPLTRAIDWRMPLTVLPARLALSPDGLYAYVFTLQIAADLSHSDPQIRKYRLSDQALLWTISLPGEVSDFQVSPGDGAYLAVSNSSPGLALYSADTGALIDSFSSFSGFPESIVWGSSANDLYSYDATNDLLRKFSPTGISFGLTSNTSIDLNADLQTWDGLHYANGIVMENHGAIYDTASGLVSARLPFHAINNDPNFKPYSIASELDMNIGRSWFWYQNGSAVILQAFDMNTHSALAYFPTESRSTFRLIRWGVDGLAYLHSGNSAIDSGIGLVQGKFVAP